MSTGSLILSALKNRISRTSALYQGREVDILVNHSGGDSVPEGLSPAQMWRTQPHLRTVVDFLARNVSQLGLHSFVRDGEERKRDRESTVAQVLCTKPNAYMTTFDLIYSLVGNYALYNRAYWFIALNKDGELEIHPFPSDWVTPIYDHLFRVSEYKIRPPGTADAVKVDAASIVAFEGWNPAQGSDSSPVDTLRLILEEQYHSRMHRLQVWKRNGRVGSCLTRPASSPAWDDTARRRFYEMFEAFVGDKGSRAGGTPILEDGMELKRVGFNSADEQWSESVKISLETVAQVYQVNPTMVGVLDSANYSNVKEFNRSLYTNTLGPLLRMIESRLNAFALPLLGAEPGQYVEFNVEEKLRGSFEEQAAVTSAAVGAPWMTRNEARRMRNLPAVDNGDSLITPLNLAVEGAAGEADAPSAEELLKRGNFAAQLIRSGFAPQAALEAAGLDPIDHLGLLPVTVQRPQQVDEDQVDEEVMAELAGEKSAISSHIERIARVIPAKGYQRGRFERELTQDLAHMHNAAVVAGKAHDLIEELTEGGNLTVPAFFDAWEGNPSEN